jgi:hypothetical protein
MPEPAGRRAAGRRVRTGAGRAAATLADGRKAVGRRARAGLPGASGLGSDAGPVVGGAGPVVRGAGPVVGGAGPVVGGAGPVVRGAGPVVRGTGARAEDAAGRLAAGRAARAGREAGVGREAGAARDGGGGREAGAGREAGSMAGTDGTGRAAWPAGQPASRFLSGPPTAAYRADSLPDAPRDDQRGRGGPSPSGSSYDDLLPGGAAEPRQSYPDPRAAPRSPSGAPYSEREWRDAAGGGQPSGRGRGQPSRHGREQPSGPSPEQPSGRSREQPQPTSGWTEADQSPSWHRGGRASGWPETGRHHGWPQRQPPAHGSNYPDAPVPRQASAPPLPDEAGWPEQGDSLEALPPVADVHDDWGGSQEQTRRGWLTPEDETDGDTW